MGAHIHYHDVNYLQLFVSKTRFGYYYALYINNYDHIDSLNKYVYPCYVTGAYNNTSPITYHGYIQLFKE